jgi:hypothetical protein
MVAGSHASTVRIHKLVEKAHVPHQRRECKRVKLGKLYAPQTKILEGRTNVSERVFEALFKGVSTVFGLQNVEKCFETRVLKSMFILPKSSFGRGKLIPGELVKTLHHHVTQLMLVNHPVPVGVPCTNLLLGNWFDSEMCDMMLYGWDNLRVEPVGDFADRRHPVFVVVDDMHKVSQCVDSQTVHLDVDFFIFYLETPRWGAEDGRGGGGGCNGHPPAGSTALISFVVQG